MWLRAPILLLVLGWMFIYPTEAGARDVVATNFNAPSVDLTGVIEYLETSNKEIVVPVPAGDGGRETAMTVTAKGPGTTHRFAAFTLYNEEPLPRDFVLVARWPGYIGSGLFWPRFGGMQVLNMQGAPGLQPQRLAQSHSDTFTLRLNPGETVTYVAELTGGDIDHLTLWQRAAYDKQQQQLSFFRGVVLGIATLTAVFMLCLFIIRLQPVFPAGALFAFASVAFIALEFGYWPVLSPVVSDVAGPELRFRAVVEALMAAGAIACLLTFLDLRRRMPNLGYPVLGVFLGSLVLAVAAWFAPAVGMGLARLLLLLTAIGGFGLIVFFWRQGVIRAQASLVAWCFLLLWTLCSTAAALGWMGVEMVSPILAWGLVLVLLTMAFTLTQFAFNQGVINSRFFEDSGRRGLALAGAEQIVWDWNEATGTLFVGPELERVLGHAKGRISRGGLKGWLELIHPYDRDAYVSSVEGAVQRGRGTFAQDFRLRRGDGTYRWYQLRARSLPGDLGRAARCIGTLSDITATKRAEEQLLTDAVRDRITGLPNYALFMDRLERAIRRTEASSNGELHVLIIDLDRFKSVNDSLGFAVGDSLLLTIARRLASVTGPNDTLARLHGDRFGIILTSVGANQRIEPLLENLRKLIARPVPLRPQEIFLTACVGVAQYQRDKARPEQLVKDAEIALYEAKRQGKDSLVVFTPAMRNNQPARLSLEEDLRQALERNQIEVAYQPVFRLHDKTLAGFEALVRWRHERYGLLEPDAFMQVAEDLGLMNELGRFVLSQAARQLGIWQRAYRSNEPLFMTVNVSSRELINRDLIDEVKTVLSREDLVPGTLKLELTETILMENPELSVKILERLQQVGVGICCDDFGTGYSALSHLKRLPFDTIKIDRCFLEGEADDEAAQIILESIVLLAHDLGMDTVVEGIESVDQADRLRELGCDFGQGFLFGAPMGARQVMEAFGGSHSIAGRGSRSIRSASFWQRLIGRGEEAGEGDHAPEQAATFRKGLEMPEPVRARVPEPQAKPPAPPARVATMPRPPVAAATPPAAPADAEPRQHELTEASSSEMAEERALADRPGAEPEVRPDRIAAEAAPVTPLRPEVSVPQHAAMGPQSPVRPAVGSVAPAAQNPAPSTVQKRPLTVVATRSGTTPMARPAAMSPAAAAGASEGRRPFVPSRPPASAGMPTRTSTIAGGAAASSRSIASPVRPGQGGVSGGLGQAGMGGSPRAGQMAVSRSERMPPRPSGQDNRADLAPTPSSATPTVEESGGRDAKRAGFTVGLWTPAEEVPVPVEKPLDELASILPVGGPEDASTAADAAQSEADRVSAIAASGIANADGPQGQGADAEDDDAARARTEKAKVESASTEGSDTKAASADAPMAVEQASDERMDARAAPEAPVQPELGQSAEPQPDSLQPRVTRERAAYRDRAALAASLAQPVTGRGFEAQVAPRRTAHDGFKVDLARQEAGINAGAMDAGVENAEIGNDEPWNDRTIAGLDGTGLDGTASRTDRAPIVRSLPETEPAVSPASEDMAGEMSSESARHEGASVIIIVAQSDETADDMTPTGLDGEKSASVISAVVEEKVQALSGPSGESASGADDDGSDLGDGEERAREEAAEPADIASAPQDQGQDASSDESGKRHHPAETEPSDDAGLKEEAQSEPLGTPEMAAEAPSDAEETVSEDDRAGVESAAASSEPEEEAFAGSMAARQDDVAEAEQVEDRAREPSVPSGPIAPVPMSAVVAPVAVVLDAVSQSARARPESNRAERQAVNGETPAKPAIAAELPPPPPPPPVRRRTTTAPHEETSGGVQAAAAARTTPAPALKAAANPPPASDPEVTPPVSRDRPPPPLRRLLKRQKSQPKTPS
ncbi:EAL domain-containing protein [Rhodoligotrophos ferricapiens]|uniref:EAL domain-containing protein n=1 Tax=Rhodoligotrophos ferricapiens TaxID=3069264 RepID=UPI00315D7E74